MTGRRNVGAEPGRWLRVAGVVVATTLVAALAFTDAVASIAWRSNPELVLNVWPGEARALAQKGELAMQVVQPGSEQALVEVGGWMRHSLAGAPLQSRALRVSGVSAAYRGDVRRAALRLNLADRITRRDLLTQLWALEDAVGRNDIAGALRRYDIALRIKPDTQQLLFPVLANAIADPAIRGALRPYFQARRAWVAAFFDYVATRGDRPAALVALLSSKSARETLAPGLISKLLGRLVSGGDFAAANMFLREVGAPVASIERDIGLGPVTTNPDLRPMTWTPAETSNASARLIAGGRFHVFAEIGATGQVLQRFMSLAPGRYVLGTRRAVTGAAPDATEEWAISCLHSGQFIAQWKGQGPATGDRPAGPDPLVLPPDCQHQYITLSVNGGAGEAPLDYELMSISIRPVR